MAPAPILIVLQATPASSNSGAATDAPTEESEELCEAEVRVAPLRQDEPTASVRRTFRVLERPRESFCPSARSRAPPAASQFVPSQQKSRLRLQV